MAHLQRHPECQDRSAYQVSVQCGLLYLSLAWRKGQDSHGDGRQYIKHNKITLLSVMGFDAGGLFSIKCTVGFLPDVHPLSRYCIDPGAAKC